MECLVIGYGSIGRRHIEVLQTLGHKVSVVSRHLETSEIPVYKTIREAFAAQRFSYIVIAVATVQHADTLQELLPFCDAETVCYIEKPLFSSTEQAFPLPDGKYVVGYILRAHPLMRDVYDLVKGKKLYSARIACGQYLPTWRPGTDYRKCYSAHRDEGGGVLRDLSHELDLLYMLCGKWLNLTAAGGHYSDLEIDSDDQYQLMWEAERCPMCSCHIDYLARNFHRDLYVEYEGGSLHLNFITGTLYHNGEEKKITLERNDMFRLIHSEAMKYDLTYLPNADDALHIITQIDAAETAAEKKIWIKNR